MIPGMARTSPSVELSAADQSAAAAVAVGPRHAAAGRVAVSVGLIRLRRDNKTWPSLLPVESTAIPPHCGGGESLEAGIGAVWETQAGRGRKPQYDLSQRCADCPATLQIKPKGMTHWSCRLMAKAQA